MTDKQKHSLVRALKTGASGIAATVTDITVLIVLVEVAGLPVSLAALLAAGAGATAGFFLAKRWAFRCPKPIDIRQISAFVSVALTTAIITAVSVHVLYTAGVPYLIAKAVSAAVIFAAWSYPAQARLVFPASR